jgi:hypothetical protein
MFMSHHQTTGQNHYIKVANKSFENVAELIYLGLMVTYQNCIHKEIKSRLNSGKTSYHAVQNVLPSCLLSENVKINIYKTCCFVWVWNLMSHHKGRTQMRVFENRTRRGTFGLKIKRLVKTA